MRRGERVGGWEGGRVGGRGINNHVVQVQDGMKVYVHKEVLIQGSEYFKSMFIGNWGESILFF